MGAEVNLAEGRGKRCSEVTRSALAGSLKTDLFVQTLCYYLSSDKAKSRRDCIPNLFVLLLSRSHKHPIIWEFLDRGAFLHRENTNLVRVTHRGTSVIWHSNDSG